MTIPPGALALDLPPNWADKYVVTYNFKTDIFTSRSGRECRCSLRASPRIGLEFTSALRGERLRTFNLQMLASQNARAFLPLQSECRRVVSGLQLSEQVCTVDIVAPWMTPGAYVFLQGPQGSEGFVISGVSGADVSFDLLPSLSFPAGARIMPALSGRIRTGMGSAHVTSAYGNIAVKFDADPATAWSYTPPLAPVTYKGYEVWSTPPNWRDGASIVHANPRSDLDFDTGRVIYFEPVAWDRRTTQLNFLGRSNAGAQLLLDTFYRCQGQRVPFWMPTWENDLPILSLVAGGSAFQTTAVSALQAAGSPTYKHVALWLRDGGIVIRRVLAMAQNGSAACTVQLDSALPGDLDASSVRMACWLMPVRFASDTFTQEWATDGIAESTVVFQMLPEDDVLEDWEV